MFSIRLAIERRYVPILKIEAMKIQILLEQVFTKKNTKSILTDEVYLFLSVSEQVNKVRQL